MILLRDASLSQKIKTITKTKIVFFICAASFLIGNSIYFVSEMSIAIFLVIMGIQFVLGIWAARFVKKEESLFYWILGVGLVSRVIVLFSFPILENDFYRFLWDGKVLLNGLNPYNYLPLDPQLDFLDAGFRGLIDWTNYHTIYPPLAQAVFALSQMLFGDSLLGLKLCFLVFEVLLVLALSKVSLWAAAVYLMSPLAIKEIANSAHFESLPMFLSFLAVYFYESKRKVSYVFLAFASAAKIYPVLLLPFFLVRDKNKMQGLIYFIVVVSIFYLPFLINLQQPEMGLTAFFRDWHWNAPLYHWIYSISGSKLLLATLFSSYYIYLLVKFREAEFYSLTTKVFLALLLCSTVVQPWYVLWLLPFAAVSNNMPGILLSGFIFAGYLHYHFDTQQASEAGIIIVAEYGLWALSSLFLRSISLPSEDRSLADMFD